MCKCFYIVCMFMFSTQKPLYFCTVVLAYLIVCLFLLHLGVLCLLRMCGVYVRHHLPPLHPRPMVVFRCQHLRMGPVCLAHRLVQVFCGLFYLCQPTSHFHLKASAPKKFTAAKFLQCKSADFFFFFLSLVLSRRERSLSTHCIAVDPVCVHRSRHTVQRSEELSCRPVSTLCCSLVNVTIESFVNTCQYFSSFFL